MGRCALLTITRCISASIGAAPLHRVFKTCKVSSIAVFMSVDKRVESSSYIALIFSKKNRTVSSASEIVMATFG
jgi:hypothetical protein